MAKTIKISVPHAHPPADVRARIERAVADFRSQNVGKMGQIDESWADNRLSFKASAMGQSVTGRLDVMPASVDVEVDLPWMLAMMADKVKARVEQETRKMLDGPK